MLVKISQFAGMFPRREPRLLDQAMAQIAENCRFESGILVPWDIPLSAGSHTWESGTKQSIYKWGNDWFGWLTDVDVVRSPIANNTNDRVCFTGDGVPKITDDSIAPGAGALPDASYNLGIAAPASAPALAVGAVPVGKENDPVRARSYVFTYVSGWGEEGPPSDASVTVEVVDTQPVTLSGMTALAGSYAGPGTKRIYRASAGTTTTQFLFVAEIPMAQTTYEDTIAGESLSEALQSTNFDPPPTDLQGLTALPNGALVGFRENDLCISEPYQPHAWPTDYRYHTDFPIVAIGVVGQSVFVTTTGRNYIANGVDPASMSLTKLDTYQACVSKRGMVEGDGVVLYPSPDGIVLVTETGSQVVTDKLLRKKDWEQYVPSSIHAVWHEGRYHAWYDTGAVQAQLILDKDGAGLMTSDEYCDAAYVDPEDDKLYLINGDTLTSWDDGASALEMEWRSKIFESPKPTNLGWGQVIAKGYPVTLKVYCDTVLKHTQVCASKDPFRLPGGFLARDWELELTSDEEVVSAMIAHTEEEIRGA